MDWIWDPRSDMWWNREAGIIIILDEHMHWELKPDLAAHWQVPLSGPLTYSLP